MVCLTFSLQLHDVQAYCRFLNTQCILLFQDEPLSVFFSFSSSSCLDSYAH
nr:MAG TPA: hypothetical protein [Caudoviricetes sp.]